MDHKENKNENIASVKGCWYIPVFEEAKARIDLDNIRYNKIADSCVLCIEINDKEGKFDDYLASLISELYYVQSTSEIYMETQDELKLDNRLNELDLIDEIHDNIIFLKRLYFKELYYLNSLAECEKSQSDLLRVQEDSNVNYIKHFYEEYLYLYNRYKYRYRYRYLIERFIYEYFDIYLFEEYDADSINKALRHRFGNASRTVINQLINIWTAIFCCELEVDNCDIAVEKVLSDNILIDNINAVDEALGKDQIQCCMCYLQTGEKEYNNLKKSTIRIRRFIEILSKDRTLKKEYFEKKSRRCYSQMWIDKCETQYFSLSCAPKTKKEKEYYKIAEDLLNLKQKHSKYEPSFCNEEMRYYYSYESSDYIKYSDIIKDITLKDKIKQSWINMMFSCCERKLLTKVEEYKKESELNSKVVHIFIKYTPCEICHRALIAYEKDKIEFEIIAPKDRRDQSKYSQIDKELKRVKKLCNR